MIPLEAVEALDTLLGTAMRVVDELRREGLLHRLVAVLQSMVPEDRESLMRIIEHDAGAGTRLAEGNVWARYTLHPNPFAQLFTRNCAGGRRSGIRYLETRRATCLGVRMVRSLPPWSAGGWEPETMETWRRLSPESRAYTTEMSRRVLAVLRANRGQPTHV